METKDNEIFFTENLLSKSHEFLGEKVDVFIGTAIGFNNESRFNICGIIDEHPDPEYIGHYRVISFDDKKSHAYFNVNNIKSITTKKDNSLFDNGTLAIFHIHIDNSYPF